MNRARSHTIDRPGATDRPCSVTVIRSEAELRALQREWSLLLEQTNATVFQSFEWVTAWWESFHQTCELHCLLFRYEGRLVGIAPLMRRTVRWFAVPVYTALEFIGRPDTDYLDFVVLPGFERRVAEAFITHFAAGNAGADLIDFEEAPAFSSLKETVPGAAATLHLLTFVVPGPPCPFVRLPRTFDEFLSSLGPNTRYSYRRKHSRIAKEHVMVSRLLRRSSDDIDGGMDTFMRIHGDRWKSLGFPSAFDDPVTRRFFLEVGRRFAARGWLRLFLMEVDNVAVAASLEFNFHRRIYMYHCNAVGPSQIMKYSPGLLIKLFAIKNGIVEGMEEYDMLRGAEDYKFDHLKGEERFNSTIRIVAPSRGSRIRFRFFIIRLLSMKILRRIRLEYYEWRRFLITRRPGRRKKAKYLVHRLTKLVNLAIDFTATYVFGRSRTPGS